jgi:hypothetical protein
MSDIEAQRGDAHNSNLSRDRAREIVRGIAAHIDQVELRDGFLGAPGARKLFERE